MDIEEQKQIESNFVKKLIDGTIPITGMKEDLIRSFYYFRKSKISKSISGYVKINDYGEVDKIFFRIRTIIKFESIKFTPEKELGKELVSFLQKKEFKNKEIYRKLSNF